MTYIILSVGLAVLFPLLASFADRRGWLPVWCSTIVACYAVGILVSNLRLWPVDKELMESVAGASMLVGLPLLLFAVRIGNSLRYAKSMLLSFALCCLSGMVATGVAAALFMHRMVDGWKVAGMITGLYTGGTPNVQAIGLALEAPADYLVLVQAADVLLGGAYLLGLLSFLPALYARFYAPTPTYLGGDAGAIPSPPANLSLTLNRLLASAAVAGGSSLLCYLFTGNWLDPTLIILLLTTISLVLTRTSITQKLGDTYPLGEYFVLIFCVALGMLADFRSLAADGLEILYFSTVAIVVTTLLHLLLAKLFRIDRDTVILSYVAALYGPVFVVQVAAAIKNRALLAAGVAVSLLGFGIGNYLGIGLAYLLRFLTT